MASAKALSCVICVYNEAERILPIIRAVTNHALIDEVIVVNDGSTDGTEAVLRSCEGIRLISYEKNRGKTYALGQGIKAAKNELLMLLDADLAGLTGAHIDALARPVIDGSADASMSLRRNSLLIYRLIGIDFVTGERVIPASLLPDAEEVFTALPRWGAEVFMNERVISHKLRIAVVPWPEVSNIRKYEKIGRWKGFLAEVGMVRDALSVLPITGVVRQHVSLIRQRVPAQGTVLEAAPAS